MQIKVKRNQTSGADIVRLSLNGRGSFMDVIEPNEYDGKLNYQATILIPKDSISASNLKVIEKAFNDTVEIGKKSKWNGRIPPDVKLSGVLRDGNEKFNYNPDLYAAYEDCYYIVAKKVEHLGRPNLIDEYGQETQNASYFKAGYWFGFDINFYPFSKKINKGVAAGLNSVMFLKEDETFSGGPSAQSSVDEFKDLFGDEFGDSKEDVDDIPL